MTEAAAGWQARLAAAQAGAADPARVAALQDALRRYVDVWAGGVDRHCGPIAAHASGLLAAGPAAWRPAALHSLGAAVPEDRLSALLDALPGHADRAAGLVRARRQHVPATEPAATRRRGPAGARAAGPGHDARPAVPAGRPARPGRGAGTVRHRRRGLVAVVRAPPACSPPGTCRTPARSRRGRPARSRSGPPSRFRSPRRARAHPGPAGLASSWGTRWPGCPTGRWPAPWPGPPPPPGQAAAEQTQHAIARRSGLRLSGWTGLDAGQLDVLLSFLAVLAGARPGPDGSRTVRTPDGRWTVRAEPAPDGAPPAVIRTPAGQLVHPDLRLTITAARPALAGSLR